jgi:hypothetical protein
VYLKCLLSGQEVVDSIPLARFGKLNKVVVSPSPNNIEYSETAVLCATLTSPLTTYLYKYLLKKYFGLDI